MLKVFVNSLPVVLMVWLIPLVWNDYILLGLYLIVIAISFGIKKERGDVKIFLLGLVAMTFFEWIFLETGVEVFYRNSLFGIMPIWLPVLWGYGFVAIKRSAQAIV